jgi:hypothetical protein
MCTFGRAAVSEYTSSEHEADDVLLRNVVETILDDYDRDSRAQAKGAYKPEDTQDALHRLKEALAIVMGDPVALAFLDDAQPHVFLDTVFAGAAEPTEESFCDTYAGATAQEVGAFPRPWVDAYLKIQTSLSLPLQRPAPLGCGYDRLEVHARELSKRLSRITAKAVDSHASAVKRGRRPKLALRSMVRELARLFEAESGCLATAGSGRAVRVPADGRVGRATKVGGGAFRRFLTAVLAYNTALHGTPAPTVGAHMLRSVLKEHHAQPPWGLPW